MRALPAAVDLPGWTIARRCVHPHASRTHSALNGEPGRGAFAAYSGSDRVGLHEQLLASVVTWPTARDARRALVRRGTWQGYLLAAGLRYVLDVATSPPAVHTYAVVVRGRVGVIVQVDRWADRSGAARAGPTSRRVLAGVLDRLDAA